MTSSTPSLACRIGTALFLALALGAGQAALAQEAEAVDEAPAEATGEVTEPPGDLTDEAIQQGGAGALTVPDGSGVEEAPVAAEDAPAASPRDVETEAAQTGIWGNLPELPFIGVPEPGGVNYQPASTNLAREIHFLSDGVHIVMAAIVLFVLALLVICIVRFNSRSNPVPARFTHNTKVEIAWTLGPVLILIGIGSFSLPVLFRQLDIPEPELTIKTTGHQWFWSYEYPDNEFTYEAFMLRPDELEENGYLPEHNLLATDTAMVVPVDTTVMLQVTAADVIHSWAMPAFGLKLDGIPGRLNALWFRAEQEGVYFGQCSELCGLDHSFMPITVKVVSQDAYEAWLDWAIDEYGGTRPEPQVAAAN